MSAEKPALSSTATKTVRESRRRGRPPHPAAPPRATASWRPSVARRRSWRCWPDAPRPERSGRGVGSHGAALLLPGGAGAGGAGGGLRAAARCRVRVPRRAWRSWRNNWPERRARLCPSAGVGACGAAAPWVWPSPPSAKPAASRKNPGTRGEKRQIPPPTPADGAGLEGRQPVAGQLVWVGRGARRYNQQPQAGPRRGVRGAGQGSVTIIEDRRSKPWQDASRWDRRWRIAWRLRSKPARD